MKTFLEFITDLGLSELHPKEKIGSGNFADVYDTQNPNIVMRIEKKKDEDNCDKFMMKSAVQVTGGVAKIYGTKKISRSDLFAGSKDELVSVTYKEKVKTNWYDILGEKYEDLLNEKYDIKKILSIMPYGKETASKFGPVPAFLQLALEAFRKKELIIDFLKNFKEAEGLIKAMQMGLPHDDLHSDNLGINSQGNLVAIDC
jgi:hypothetical protein